MEDPTAAIEAALALTDPSERAKALSRIIDAVPHLQTRLRELRKAAYQEMHDQLGMSWQEIADDQGVHRNRAAQIAKGVVGGRKKRAETDGPPEDGP